MYPARHPQKPPTQISSTRLLLLGLGLLLAACSAPPPAPAQTPAAQAPAQPAATPTTLVMVVTVPPIPTVAKPTQPPAQAAPSPTTGLENPLKLASDGVTSPPAFRLMGGTYLVAWEVPRPTNQQSCSFAAVLMSEASVQPFTLQTLGPWNVEPTEGHTGSRRIDGLGAGGYTLRPGGNCPWTVTITPLRPR